MRQRLTLFQDLDGSGRIRYTEFLAATIEAQGAISEERLAEAFDRLDSDDSGYISAQNLAEMLGQDFPADEINSIIQEADLTKDGLISYAEFLALWETKNEESRDKQLKLLGTPQQLSEFEFLSYRGSKISLQESTTSLDGVNGRASFILGKHGHSTHTNLKRIENEGKPSREYDSVEDDFSTKDYIP